MPRGFFQNQRPLVFDKENENNYAEKLDTKNDRSRKIYYTKWCFTSIYEAEKSE